MDVRSVGQIALVSTDDSCYSTHGFARLSAPLTRLGGLASAPVPVVTPLSDASVLGQLCDGVIMVVRAGSTAFDLAQTRAGPALATFGRSADCHCDA